MQELQNEVRFKMFEESLVLTKEQWILKVFEMI